MLLNNVKHVSTKGSFKKYSWHLRFFDWNTIKTLTSVQLFWMIECIKKWMVKCTKKCIQLNFPSNKEYMQCFIVPCTWFQLFYILFYYSGNEMQTLGYHFCQISQNVTPIFFIKILSTWINLCIFYGYFLP